MAIFKRLQTLARAERGARRGAEASDNTVHKALVSLRQSVRTLRQSDASLYQQLQANRDEQQALDRRAIQALESNREDLARELVMQRMRLQRKEAEWATEREQIAALLLENERALEALARRLPAITATAAAPSAPQTYPQDVQAPSAASTPTRPAVAPSVGPTADPTLSPSSDPWMTRPDDSVFSTDDSWDTPPIASDIDASFAAAEAKIDAVEARLEATEALAALDDDSWLDGPDALERKIEALKNKK